MTTKGRSGSGNGGKPYSGLCGTPFLRMTESDHLHGRLRVAVTEGKVVIRVNEVRLNTPGSPVHRPGESLLLLVLPLGGMGASVWQWGGWIGLASLIPWAVIYMIGGRWLLRRVNARACRFALASDAHLDELWRWGGLMLQTADGAGVARPGDDWRVFVQAHCARVPTSPYPSFCS